MAINKKKTEDNSYSVKVLKVKKFDSGDIACDIEVNGVNIYGCVYKNEFGFLSFPSRKGSDGKYYSHAYFKISPDCLADIEKQIEELL